MALPSGGVPLTAEGVELLLNVGVFSLTFWFTFAVLYIDALIEEPIFYEVAVASTSRHSLPLYCS